MNRLGIKFCNLPKVVHLPCALWTWETPESCDVRRYMQRIRGALMHTASARIGICYYPIPQMLSRHLCLTNGLVGGNQLETD